VPARGGRRAAGPPGTPPDAVAAVRADAVQVGTPSVPPPADYRITVTALRRGILLVRDLLAGKSLLDWSGNPTAARWQVSAP
jgi:hypothetical protein